ILTPITAGVAVTPHEPVRILHLSDPPLSIAITNDGQLGFAALSNGRVDMLDLPGRSIVTSIAVGGTPHFVITGLYPPVTGSPSNSSRAASSSPKPIVSLFTMVSIGLLGALLLGALWLFWRRYQRQLADQRSADKGFEYEKKEKRG
ncbi:MAG TPA: hypothetical protein VH164_11995, partial [Ktedonobacteraceae bacterium]|nr:hypothetical protein [Ktedonobacteraceae bacterium]